MASRSKRIVRCPNCGFAFEISYGRAFACSGCPSSLHCEYAKCPKCEYEFPVDQGQQLNY
ncbi:MAG: hypothetical protein ACP5QI_08145 [Candidatus Bathyarchaeia archaeon]